MDLDTLWQLLEPRLSSIELKLDKANGRSNKNCWSIKALWVVVVAEAGLFTWWIKSLIGAK